MTIILIFTKCHERGNLKTENSKITKYYTRLTTQHRYNNTGCLPPQLWICSD